MLVAIVNIHLVDVEVLVLALLLLDGGGAPLPPPIISRTIQFHTIRFLRCEQAVSAAPGGYNLIAVNVWLASAQRGSTRLLHPHYYTTSRKLPVRACDARLYFFLNNPFSAAAEDASCPPASLALDLFAWSRYAEVSADRAGAYCAEDLPSVARALFKLASGLRDDRIVQFDLDEFLRQVDDMLALGEQPGQGAPMQDWFLTHPFSPLRVKALTVFDRSVLMRPGGIDKHDLEDQVQTVMGLMEPDYLKGKTDVARAMRNLFVAGAIAVADADEGVSDKEQKALEDFLEDGFALEKLDPERLRELLPKRVEAVREKASLSQRMQVVRDLCLVAGVEQPVAQAESRLLNKIARGLELPGDFVTQCLEASPELD